ncbi:hypothetical protein SAMN05444417_0062 [Wenxinia saemankumensis]|uniref:Sulfatase n=1 Tax=Wenxinia saemankumensis TaxID=1447782 RepID=A0A1M5ZYT6_9RHOB|nr:hypothetical protein SAMN05444417_0062 [Wenxinia saemankumensis]
MTDRPNILVLCTDRQRWDTLGATGNTSVRTPDMDAIYEGGWGWTTPSARARSARPPAPVS